MDMLNQKPELKSPARCCAGGAAASAYDYRPYYKYETQNWVQMRERW